MVYIHILNCHYTMFLKEGFCILEAVVSWGCVLLIGTHVAHVSWYPA